MPYFRKKPVVIEAVQFRAGEQPGELAGDVAAGRVRYPEDGTMLIETLEGVMCARPGDWIIRGVKGELYPCKPDIFERTYESAPADGRPFIDRPAVCCTACGGAGVLPANQPPLPKCGRCGGSGEEPDSTPAEKE